jgi:uncharacterized membrane protein
MKLHFTIGFTLVLLGSSYLAYLAGWQTFIAVVMIVAGFSLIAAQMKG